MAQSRTKKLIGNTAVIAAGQFGSKILVYLLTRLYTSLLSQDEYSIASNISDIAVLLVPIVSLGFGEAIFRLAKGNEYKKREVFSDAFAVFLCGILLLGLTLPILSAIPYFHDYIALIAFYTVASAFHSLVANYIRAKGMVRLYALQGIINTALVICLNIIFLIPLKMSAVGYVLSVPIADVTVTFFIIAAAKLWQDLDLRSIRIADIRSMLRYSLPLIPTTIFMWIVNISDRFMVTYFCGDAANGLYTAAYKIPTLLGVMNSIFIYAWQISAMDERRDKKRFFSSVFDSYASLMFLAGGAIAVFSKVITMLMFDSSYHSAWIYIPMLTFAMVIHNFSSFLDSDNMVRLRSMPTMLTALAGALTNIILNFLLIKVAGLGAYGAAIATYISYNVTFLMRARLSRDSIVIQLPRMIANNILMLLIVITTSISFVGWVLLDILLLCALCLLNARPLLRTLERSGILKRLKVRR